MAWPRQSRCLKLNGGASTCRKESLTSTITVANPGIAGYVVENLTPGTWYFAVAAYNSFGVEGELSDLTSMLVQ